jgi:hypothetical protein
MRRMGVRIYLDHKDYANITKGLRGDPQHHRDAEIYESLRDHVARERVVGYFSALHIVEAIRSDDDDWLRSYSEVVDSLTSVT